MSSITKAVSRYSTARFLNFAGKNVVKFKTKQTVYFHTSPFLCVEGQQIKMPSLSPTMSEGKIVKWLKKEGDTISPGDVLCDIETDKAVVSMETEEEGILAKILVPENSQVVSVGSLIALMVQTGENWQEVEMPSDAVASQTTAPAQKEKPKPADSQAPLTSAPTGPTGIQVKMPSLSPTMTAGTVLKWYKKEGDAISAGDVLCDIQTDKAVISFETDEEGILAKILVPEDTKDIKVGTLIALIVEENQDWKNVVVPESDSVESVPGGEESKPCPATTTTASAAPMSSATPPPASSEAMSDKSGKPFGPAVRSLLSIYQLDPGSIKSTGRNNMLLKEDVLRYVEENKLQKKPPKPVSLHSATAQPVSKPSDVSRVPPQPSAPIAAPATEYDSPYKQSFGRRSQQRYTDIELSNVRRVIAKRLTESKQGIPHSYGKIHCHVDELLSLRKEMNYHGISASLNDYIIKGAACALEACPRVNVINVNGEYRHSSTVDIAVAVATPNGLITPIVPNVTNKSIYEISQTIRELAPRARAGKLKPHEFQGGSFTISNLGMFGIKHFTAIINPPQCAILAVGALIDWYGPDQKTHHDIAFTLSYDRRALEEDEAAMFLEKLKFFIENPKQLVAENVSAARALGL